MTMEFTCDLRPEHFQRVHRRIDLFSLALFALLLWILSPTLPTVWNFATAVQGVFEQMPETDESGGAALADPRLWMIAGLILAGVVLIGILLWLVWYALGNFIDAGRRLFSAGSPPAMKGMIEGVQYGATSVRLDEAGVELTRELVRTAIGWPLFASAELKGDLLMLKRTTGSFYLVPVAAAPGTR